MTPIREVEDIKTILAELVPDLVERDRTADLLDLHKVLKQEAELISAVVKT